MPPASERPLLTERTPKKPDNAKEPSQADANGAPVTRRTHQGNGIKGSSRNKGQPQDKRAEGILSPLILQMNPINPPKQKKQTNRVIEPARIGAMAPTLPPERIRAAANRKPPPERDTPDHLRDNLPQKGRRHSFTPHPPNEPHQPTNPKKPNGVIEPARIGAMAPTAAPRNTAGQRQKGHSYKTGRT